MNEESRTEHFALGVNPVRPPSFSTRQQGAGHGPFQAHSVLEPYIQSSGIGLADHDRSRQLAGGGLLSTSNGQSEGTYQRSQWLQSPYRTVG